MNQPIIEVKNLSKQYQINNQSGGYLALRDVLANLIKKPLFKKSPKFWALKDLNFTVQKGEILGIIGPNGAGKSTLLKILTRITPPTNGQAILRGKVASLLEVGTGFHPELTGRENVFLNGAILGMSRSEVKKKFDEIVEFSGVAKFIDMPVKHYSSGMQVRLAFSVAAHLEPDILLVDEVLAVGDAEFQKKSLGKMENASKHGRTVIFVSHNLSSISSLCDVVILLKKGRIVKSGKPTEVISNYLRSDYGALPKTMCLPSSRFTNEFARMIYVKAHDQGGKVLESFDIRKPIGIDVEYQSLTNNDFVWANIQIKNNSGILLFNSLEKYNENKIMKVGRWQSTCWIPGNFLAEGLFFVRATLSTINKNEIYEIDFPNAITFNVHDNGKPGSVKGKLGADFPGVIRPKLNWKRVMIDKSE